MLASMVLVAPHCPRYAFQLRSRCVVCTVPDWKREGERCGCGVICSHGFYTSVKQQGILAGAKEPICYIFVTLLRIGCSCYQGRPSANNSVAPNVHNTRYQAPQNAHKLTISAHSISCSWHSRCRGGHGAPVASRRIHRRAATTDRREYSRDRKQRSEYSGDRKTYTNDRQGESQQEHRRSESTAGQQQQRRGKGSRRDAGLKQDFFARESWKQVGANADTIDALKQLGITRPSHVQAEALVALFSGLLSAKFCAVLLTCLPCS